MKKNRNMLLLLYLLIGNISLAHNEPTMVTKVIGNDTEIVYMHNVVQGPINLFSESTPITAYIWTKENGFEAVTTKEVDVFYIGIGSKVEQINAGNYNRLLKKYLPNSPKLHKRIGKKGFSYKDLPTIISYYNRDKNRLQSPKTKKEEIGLITL